MEEEELIPFDFEYYRPSSTDEAFRLYHGLAAANKKPLYYSGGTEIISMARMQSIKFDAVIDLKDIPDCCVLSVENGVFSIGGCLTLTAIAEYNGFPLLTKTIKRIADHTIQGKITLAGNLAGTIKYRESSLPLWISDCSAKVMSAKGIIEKPFSKIFNGRLKLGDGEFLISVSVSKADCDAPFLHVKKTKNLKIDYPLISFAAIKKSGKLSAAITGYGNRPLLLPENLLDEKAIKKTIESVRSECKEDLSGSREYKEFVLGQILEEAFA